MKHDIFEMINTIDRLNHNLTPTLTRLLEQQNRLRESFRPATSALATAMEANYLAASRFSDALLPVAKEWEAVADFIREQDYSHLFISDSLSSKLMDLIESVETEVPGAKEEIFRKADINGVSIQANEIDFQKFYRILAVVLPLLFAIMSHHDAVASSEQSRQQHQEITNQFDKKFQELFELIKSVASNPKPDQSSETKIPEEHSYPSKNPCSTGRIDD